ncbi:MAG: glycosyltransferase [Gemmatimonadetes bacterium]|nr:glycosyltransferase [Gemmatimonadota bacterium]
MTLDYGGIDSGLPRLDRRMLERMAVGAPMPARVRTKHTVGLRVGGLRRVVGRRAPRPVAPDPPFPAAPPSPFQTTAPAESAPIQTAIVKPALTAEPEPEVESGPAFQVAPLPQPALETTARAHPEPTAETEVVPTLEPPTGMEGASIQEATVLPDPPAPAVRPFGGPLLLVVADRALRGSTEAVNAVLQAARDMTAGGEVAIIDLDVEHPYLADRLNARGPEGLADVLLFGTSLRHAIRPSAEAGVSVLPVGAAPNMDELFRHPRWQRSVSEAERRGITLLANGPHDEPGLHALAAVADAVILVAHEGSATDVRADLPADLRLAGVFTVPMPLAREPASVSGAVVSEAEATDAAVIRTAVIDRAALDAAAIHAPAGGAEAVDANTEAEDEELKRSRLAMAAVIAGSTTLPDEPPTERAPGAKELSPADPAGGGPGSALSRWLRAEEERLESGGGGSSPPSLAEAAAQRAREITEREPEAPSGPARAGVAAGAVATAAAIATTVRPSAQSAPTAPPEVEPPLAEIDEREDDDRLTRVIAPPRPAGQPPAKYIVPRIPEWREKIIRVSAVLILAYWTYYIAWRWTSTLNLEALWFSIPLVLAETWGLLTAYFMVFTTWRLNHRDPLPAPSGLSVDVFITTYDEPLEIIRRTAISARAMRYPHQTYVLDDGRREEVRAMAAEFGIGYIERENNEHAKAGNLNNALKHTSGDFILQLDADHAPLPQMLDQVLGFFEDPAVAFVQTPQDFYNTDSFTSDLNEAAHRLWEEQRLFFAVIQPGKDRTNSAFFCGSCAAMRRSALDEIGGFSTESITEDIETSLLLHARGWKSVYYGESLAYGLAAGSADAFHTQHRRWARGAMQVIRKFNPLGYPGLAPAHRIGYFYSLTAYVIGLQKLVFYSAPIVFFLTGVLPISALDRDFLIRFVPYLVVSIALAEMLARGLGFTWLVERYQMAKFWTYASALPTFFTSRRLRFRVTPKGPGRVPLGTYLPQVLLMFVTVISVNWATVAFSLGWIDYDAPGWRSLAFQVNFLWAALNFVFAAYVVRLSIRIQQQRQDHRFADRFPMHVRLRDQRGRLGEREIALTEDLNANGLRFRSVAQFEPGSDLKLTLPLSTGEASANALVVHVRRDPEADVEIYVHGVEFRDIPLDVRDAIELHCAHHSVPIEQMRYQKQTGVLARAQDWVRNARGEPRRRVRLPTWVQIGPTDESATPREEVAFLEEISRSGARLIMNQAVAPGTHIIFEVPGTELRGEGPAVFSRALETPIGVRFAVGMRREIGRDQDPRTDRKMRIPRLWRAAGVATSLALALGGTASRGAAQLEAAIYGSGEIDTENTSVASIGASVQPPGLGFKPVASILAYQLTFPAGTGTQSVTAFNPALGLRYQWVPGALQASVGYLFLSGETDAAVGAPGGGESGITGAVLADYWGDGTTLAQGIASYNFADDYIWSRLRATRQVTDFNFAPIRLGAEVVGQGEDVFDIEEDDLTAVNAGYRAFQAGVVGDYQLSPDFRLTGIVGGKTDNITGNPDIFPYFKVEFLYLP